MKTKYFATLALALGLPVTGFAAESAAPKTGTQARTNEVDLLRRTLQEQRSNPDKVIRSPSVAQSAPATPTTQAPAPKPEPPKPVTPPAQVTVPTTSYTIPTNFPSYEELENAYLNRKISARRFEEALKLLGQHQKIIEEREQKLNKMLREQGVAPPGSPEHAAQQKKISDAEGKVDELMRRKAQRDQTATNAAPAAAQLTKRQRLDALLRQMIDGKITNAEYQDKREKIVAEPD